MDDEAKKLLARMIELLEAISEDVAAVKLRVGRIEEELERVRGHLD